MRSSAIVWHDLTQVLSTAENSNHLTLSLKCLSYCSLPFVHKGVHLDPTIFKYFSVGILVRNLHHICIHLKQLYISKKNIKKYCVSKWQPKNKFSFCKNSHVTKIWKNTFPMEFSNEIWLKVGEHEYIYICEIKFEIDILFRNGGQNKFVTLRNNANLC